MTPQNNEWAALIEECYPSAKKATRYAIKKGTVFDRRMLKNEILKLPAGYELRKIDADIYEQCLETLLRRILCRLSGAGKNTCG